MAHKKLPKKPKRPRKSASFDAWKRFDERYKLWMKRCHEIKNAHKYKETLVKKYSVHY